MKKGITFLIIILTVSCYSQNEVKVVGKENSENFSISRVEACNKDSVFVIVDNLPEYENGSEQLIKDLNEHLSFGKSIKGKIYLIFTINCKGKAFGFQCLVGLDKESNEKLIKGMEELQSWKSGSQRGRNVDCSKALGFEIKKGKIYRTD